MAITESQDAGHVIKLAKFWAMLGMGMLRNLGYYASREFPWQEEIPYSGNVFAPGREWIRREPLGVCVGIVPWNFPMYIAMWKIAPALLMGNTMVLKPASLTPISAVIIAEASKAAGIPDGVLNVITGPGGELGKVLCTHKDVDKISLTGSTEVGREIMKMAADTVKKVTLELGGKSANIILDDADIDLAVEGACYGTFFHQGQVCSSGTRVLVHAKIYDEFIEKMKIRAEKLRIGYQLDPNSHLGPLVSREQLATVENYVKIGKAEGARLSPAASARMCRDSMEGYYYNPTIFADVKNNMRIAQEEIFGPVVSIIKYHSDEEALAIANDSISVWPVVSFPVIRPGPAHRPWSAHRYHVDQQLPYVCRFLPLRRLQAIRCGPRTGSGGTCRIHPDQAHSRKFLRLGGKQLHHVVSLR